MTATKSKAIEVITPGFWAEACDHLARRDRVMKRVIPLFGDACLESRGDGLAVIDAGFDEGAGRWLCKPAQRSYG